MENEIDITIKGNGTSKGINGNLTITEIEGAEAIIELLKSVIEEFER